MKPTRSIGPPAAAPATHVLHWVPGYLNSDGSSCWELQGAADYEAGQPSGRDPELDAPRDEPVSSLALWVTAQLGHPVEMSLAHTTITTGAISPLNVHIAREPVYYVRPANAAAPAASR